MQLLHLAAARRRLPGVPPSTVPLRTFTTFSITQRSGRYLSQLPQKPLALGQRALQDGALAAQIHAAEVAAHVPVGIKPVLVRRLLLLLLLLAWMLLLLLLLVV